MTEKRMPKNPKDGRDDGPDLTPEDERLLDQAWKNVAENKDRRDEENWHG